jgi:hypothetical protein
MIENDDGWFPVSSIEGLCCCLYEEDYLTTTPLAFEPKDVFVVRYMHDVEDHSLVIHTEKDYAACGNVLLQKQKEVETRLEDIESSYRGTRDVVKSKEFGEAVYAFPDYRGPKVREEIPVEFGSVRDPEEPPLKKARNKKVKTVRDVVFL